MTLMSKDSSKEIAIKLTYNNKLPWMKVLFLFYFYFIFILVLFLFYFIILTQKKKTN